MTAQFLTLRLNDDDVQIVSRLRIKTGLSKSDIVKQALRNWANTSDTPSDSVSLYSLKVAQSPREGDASRQSAHIKQVVRSRLQAKHS
jgi:hypothetical protein